MIAMSMALTNMLVTYAMAVARWAVIQLKVILGASCMQAASG